MINKLFPTVKPKPMQSKEDKAVQEQIQELDFLNNNLSEKEMEHVCTDSLLRVEDNLKMLKDIAVAVIDTPKYRDSVLKVCVDGAAVYTALLFVIKNQSSESKAGQAKVAAEQWLKASDAYISLVVEQ